MEDRLTAFLSTGDGRGYGSGSGRGDGYGYGYGYGYSRSYSSGNGSGTGSGRGRGYDFNHSNGYGRGYGYGDGYGSGYGDGSGSGTGNGLRYFYDNGLHSIAGQRVYLIDGVPTIIESVHQGYACGYIVGSIANLVPCYIVNYYGHFAHGETLGEALRDARAKYERSMPVKMRIEFFMTLYPDIDKPYPARELFASHGTLTGSCEQGRKNFCETHGLDMDKEYTVREFIDICRDAYGGEVIRRLERMYNTEPNQK